MSEKLNGDEPGADNIDECETDPGGGDGRRSVTIPRGSADKGDDPGAGNALTNPYYEADEVGFERRSLSLGMVGPKRKGKHLVKAGEKRLRSFTGQQRLLILDVWKRSGLCSGDFAPLVGISKHTLFGWKKRFELHGPEGLMSKPKGPPKGSRLPEVTKRTILMLKSGNPEYGCDRISDMLARSQGLQASPGSVSRVLKEAGYEVEEVKTTPHRPHKRRFERARPNQLWQTDIFTFTLKRQNRRVYLVGFMDDHSRFIVGWGLFASATTVLVVETLRSGIASYNKPEEVLTDNGPQYVTWRGTSAFHKELVKQGIKHVVSKPKNPQTLGKIERFWGSLWRELVEKATFLDLTDARERIALYIDHYNCHRTHQGIDGLVPADRFFGAAPEVLRTMKQRVQANALELAQSGAPRKPFYMTGQVDGKSFSVHSAGNRVFMTGEDGRKEEVDLVSPEAGNEEPPAPGVSAVDELADVLAGEEAHDE